MTYLDEFPLHHQPRGLGFVLPGRGGVQMRRALIAFVLPLALATETG